jgi:hypothetical protein
MIVFFWLLYRKLLKQAKFLGHFFQGLFLNFVEKWLGQHFGRFFTNSSGHPDRTEQAQPDI